MKQAERVFTGFAIVMAMFAPGDVYGSDARGDYVDGTKNLVYSRCEDISDVVQLDLPVSRTLIAFGVDSDACVARKWACQYVVGDASKDQFTSVMNAGPTGGSNAGYASEDTHCDRVDITFLSGVDIKHELYTPLSPVSGYLRVKLYLQKRNIADLASARLISIQIEEDSVSRRYFDDLRKLAQTIGSLSQFAVTIGRISEAVDDQGQGKVIEIAIPSVKTSVHYGLPAAVQYRIATSAPMKYVRSVEFRGATPINMWDALQGIEQIGSLYLDYKGGPLHSGRDKMASVRRVYIQSFADADVSVLTANVDSDLHLMPKSGCVILDAVSENFMGSIKIVGGCVKLPSKSFLFTEGVEQHALSIIASDVHVKRGDTGRIAERFHDVFRDVKYRIAE